MKTFDRKVYVSVFLVLLLAITVVAGAMYSLQLVITERDQIIDVYASDSILAQELRVHWIRELASMPTFVLSGKDRDLAQLHRAHDGFTQTLKQLKVGALGRTEFEALAKIERMHAEADEMGKVGIEMKLAGHSTLDVDRYFNQVAGQHNAELDRTVTSFVNTLHDDLEHAAQESHKASRRLIDGLTLALASILILCGFLASLLRRLMETKRAEDVQNALLLATERQLSLARKETVEMVAHDLKSPLASIIMSTELNLESPLGTSEQIAESRDTMMISLRSAQAMRRLIDNLLDHAKIESGSLDVKPTEQRVAPFLSEIARRFEPLAAGKGLQLHCDFIGPLPPARFDECRLDQVISNLLANAIKFTSAGHISLSAHAERNRLTIQISDTGSGLREDQIAHIFERYWQARETAHHGTGLGLAISKAIVEAHGGEIFVESRLGVGSNFVVELPCLVESLHAPSYTPVFASLA